MKKKIISIALMVMALSPVAAMAQSPDSKSGKAEKTCCKKEKSDKKCERPSPFDGLNLTESQRTRLAQLNEKREALRKEEIKAQKELKQSIDSTRNKAKKEANIEYLKAKKAAKAEYLKEVREIVGTENYVKYLENMVINQGGHKKDFRSHDMKKDGHRKDGKFDKQKKDKSEKRNGNRENR